MLTSLEDLALSGLAGHQGYFANQSPLPLTLAALRGWKSLVNLTKLDLSQNEFIGDQNRELMDLFGTLTKLRWVELYRGQIDERVFGALCRSNTNLVLLSYLTSFINGLCCPLRALTWE